jgi:hypothetical protein
MWIASGSLTIHSDARADIRTAHNFGALPRCLPPRPPVTRAHGNLAGPAANTAGRVPPASSFSLLHYAASLTGSIGALPSTSTTKGIVLTAPIPSSAKPAALR